jgi:heptosyltransferase-2
MMYSHPSEAEPQNIVIRMPNWVGDCVMATPVLTDLRHRFPSAKITVMCHEKLAKLFEHDEDIDEVFGFTYPNGWLPRLHNRDLVARLRAAEYDLGILLPNSFSSAWWFWQGGVCQRLGYRGHWRRFLLTKALKEPVHIETQHLVLTYKMLLEPLGISLSGSRPRIHLLPKEVEAARELLARQGVPAEAKLIGINPGAAFGTAKCWLPERFRAVTELLLKDSRNYIIYFGDPTGAPLVKSICSGLPERVINLAGGTNLRELVALIQLCDVLLTNDSGPMHIAAAVETPLVALFGSTSDVKTGPYGQAIVIHKHVPCSPCYKKVCPIDFPCMTQISVEEVYQKIQSLLPD